MTSSLKTAEPSEDDFVDMAQQLRPAWDVVAVELVPEGVNSTAILTVETDTGRQQVVLKAATSSAPLVETRTSAEPRLLSLLDRETSVPVPTVYGICDSHDRYPSPFFLLEYLDGESFEHRGDALSPQVRETVFREAGRNLASLHQVDSFSSVGTLGYRDGELSILDTEEKPQFERFHDWLLHSCEKLLDCIEEDGGLFPDLTDDPTRFDALVPEMRTHFREAIPDLPEPTDPTYCHKDYGYSNVLIDPDTGHTEGVIDWGLCMVAPPAFNLALTEAKLLRPDLNDVQFGNPGRATELRQTLLDSYTENRQDWQPRERITEQLNVYRMNFRLTMMACLPMGYHDSQSRMESREERAAEHRQFVREQINP